ncbi:MAG: TonB-dependent receptor [Ferruginibacter sp.]
MKYIITILLLCFINTAALQAQNGNGRIYGVIKDTVTSSPMESATVIIYRPDSTVAMFKITDKNGRYDISGLPLNAKYILAASFSGYKEYRKNFTMDGMAKKMDTIFMQLKGMDEVVVTSIAPIRMNGDTLEINPAAFKMSNDAVAEDLLNKVPGVVIWADGSITMNGKAIPKVLVDGKPFLGSSDHRIATQNLPKNIIDKIQVYNEVDMSSEANRNNITDANVPKDSLLTMDIKLKADKKNGYFGKFGAGAGTDSRYQSDMAMQFYNKRTTISAGGGANNINAEIAGLNDLQREGTFRNNYAVYRSRSNFGRSGINRVISPGLQFTHSFSQNDNDRRANRITGGYDYNNNAGKTLSQTYQERYYKEGDQIINSNAENNSNSEQHALRVSYNKSLDYNKTFSINNTGSFSNSGSQNSSSSVITTRDGKLISDRSSSSSSNGSGKSFSSSVNYANFDSENPLKSFDISATFSRSENTSARYESSVYNFYSATGINSTVIRRRYGKESGNTSFNSNFSYSGLRRLLFGRFSLFGISLSTNHNISYRKNEDVNDVFDIDANDKENTNRNLTYSESFSTFQYTPNFNLGKSFNKWSSRKSNYYNISTSFGKQFIHEENTSSRVNRNLSRNFAFPQFRATASYSRQVTDAYRVNGGLSFFQSYGYPSINQIAPVVDSLNLYSIYKGGLNLVNSRNNSVSLNMGYGTNTPKKPAQFNFNFNASLNNTMKPYVDSTVNLRDTVKVNGLDSIYLNGKQVRYTINGNRRYSSNIGYSASYSRKVKNNQVQVQYNGSMNAGMSPSYFDNIYTLINSNSISQSLRFTYYFKTLLIVGVGSNADFSSSRQTGYKNSRFNTRTLSGEFNVTVNPNKDASISSNISYSKNNGIVKPITIWNASASYRFLKSKQAEVRFTATDILKQYRNISYYANPDGVTSSVTNGLQQYFMLSFSYFPRKFGLSGKGGNGNRMERPAPGTVVPGNIRGGGNGGGNVRRVRG